jgi:membrane protein YqaA with SNARE-associated domain
MLSGQQWLARLGGSVYDLVTAFGGLGVLLLAIADSSFLSFPEGNDLLIVILSSGGSWWNMVYYVGMTITGSVIGCMLLYLLGRKGGSPLLRRRFSQKSIERAERLFERYGILTVVIPSILPPPMPFKIFVLSAGVFRLKAVEFIVAVALGRTVRYSMWGILAVLYGNAVKVYMQENLQLVGAVLLACFGLLAAGTIAYYAYRYRSTRYGKEI